MDLRGLVARPVFSLNPYATPDPDIYLCSAATPPGGGVHGMCGVNAARAALKSRLR
jgi:phytoene dehydrogenase-like protein